MRTERGAYDELCAYTLTRGDPEFIHQHVVDVFAAQNASETSKPIGVTFALVGLFLHVEKEFTGRQVQRVHMQLARRKQSWPRLLLPADRGAITALDVMTVPEGAERDRAIHDWAVAVWSAFAINRHTIITLLEEHRIAF